MMLVFPQSINVAYLLFVNFLPPGRIAISARRSSGWSLPDQPRFHHWHHTSQVESIDKNFAIHFRGSTRSSGLLLPRQVAGTYGLHDEEIPPGFWGQFSIRVPRSRPRIPGLERDVLGRTAP
jgi:hypothetical protein